MQSTTAADEKGTDTEPLRQDSTRHTLLGVDDEGRHHVYSRERQLVTVVDATGIAHQYQTDWQTWLDYMNDKDAWDVQQKYNLGRALGRVVEGGA